MKQHRLVRRFAMALAIATTSAVPAFPAVAQQPGQLMYHGTLRGLSNNGGVAIIVVAGPPQFSDFKTCGQAATSGDGTYSNLLIDKGCIAKEGSLSLYFLVHGEKAGKTSLRFYPPGRTDDPEGLDATRVPGPPPADTATPVLTRYYGALQFGTAAAPQGTPITISSSNSAGGAACGSGTVVDQKGGYVADVTNTGCINISGDTHFSFSTGGQIVGNAAQIINLGNADTYGNVHSLGLNGSAPTAGPPQEHAMQGSVSTTEVPPGSSPNTPLRATIDAPQDLPPPQTGGGPATALPPGPCPDSEQQGESSGIVAGADRIQTRVGQGVDCTTGVPVRVQVTGDAAFQKLISDCFGNLRRAAKGSRHLRDLLDSLDNKPTGENSTQTTVRQGTILTGIITAGFVTAPEPDNDATEAAVAAGIPQSSGITFDATLAKLLGLSTPLPAPGTGIIGAIFFNTPFDPCATIVHEITHGSDFMYGQFDSTLQPAAGGLPADELKALAQENRYRLSQGLPAVETYIYHGQTIELPESVKFPDP